MNARKERSRAHKNGAVRKKSAGKTPTGTRRGARHLFERWDVVARRLRKAKHVALFLDFDGTLAPLQPHPERAELAASTRRVLGRLARHARASVYVVSGRRAADVRKRVRVPGVCCVGLHGWERGKGKPRATATERFVQKLRREVEAKLSRVDGVWVEDKFISFAVHYRRATARQAGAILREIVAPFLSRIRVMNGKRVWEVLPLEVEGKGAAVRSLLAELKAPALPIYVGDDTTDEPAFEALSRGVTVRVGNPRGTKACYVLRNPGEVRGFLEKLEAEIA